MREVNSIKVVFESYFESQGVVEGTVVHLGYLGACCRCLVCLFSFSFVSVVSYVETISLPAHIFLFSVFLAIN